MLVPPSRSGAHGCSFVPVPNANSWYSPSRQPVKCLQPVKLGPNMNASRVKQRTTRLAGWQVTNRAWGAEVGGSSQCCGIALALSYDTTGGGWLQAPGVESSWGVVPLDDRRVIVVPSVVPYNGNDQGRAGVTVKHPMRVYDTEEFNPVTGRVTTARFPT